MPAWLTVDSKFRRSNSDFPFDLLKITTEIFALISISLNSYLAVATARKDRGVDKVSFALGGESVGTSLAHNCPVELMIFKNENLKAKSMSYSSEALHLWNNRIDHWGLENEQRNIRKAS